MAITEESRHELHTTLERNIGPDAANTLMEHLPPAGWADVATKHDLGQLEERTDIRFKELEKRMVIRLEELEKRMVIRFGELEKRMDLRFEGFEHSFEAKLSRGLHRQFVQIIGATGALLTLMLSLAVAVNQLLGG